MYKWGDEGFYTDFFEELEARNANGTPETPSEPGLSQENVYKITEDLQNPLPPDEPTLP